MPVFYKEANHLSELEIGLLLGFNGFLIFAFEMPLIKWLENTKYSKTGLVLFGTILTGLSVLILTFTSWIGILIVGMILMTVGEMISFPFSNAFALQRSKRGKQGEYMALYSISFSIAHTFGHNLGLHVVSGYGFDANWYVMTVLATISILLLVFLKLYLDMKKQLN